MPLYSEQKNNVTREMELLQENTQRLNVHSSKLYSQKLHLHSLIAKRDRIDYEIRGLKKKIAADRNIGRKVRNNLREQETVCSQILSKLTIPLNESSHITETRVAATLAEKKFEELDKIIEILLEMRPFSEDDQF